MKFKTIFKSTEIENKMQVTKVREEVRKRLWVSEDYKISDSLLRKSRDLLIILIS